MPWWALFDARDKEVELVCSELLTLYRAHDDKDGSSSSNCNGSKGNSRDGEAATIDVGNAGGEAGPVNGGGVESRVVESSQASFAEGLSTRQNSAHGP